METVKTRWLPGVGAGREEQGEHRGVLAPWQFSVRDCANGDTSLRPCPNPENAHPQERALMRTPGSGRWRRGCHCGSPAVTNARRWCGTLTHGERRMRPGRGRARNLCAFLPFCCDLQLLRRKVLIKSIKSWGGGGDTMAVPTKEGSYWGLFLSQYSCNYWN